MEKGALTESWIRLHPEAASRRLLIDETECSPPDVGGSESGKTKPCGVTSYRASPQDCFELQNVFFPAPLIASSWGCFCRPRVASGRGNAPVRERDRSAEGEDEAEGRGRCGRERGPEAAATGGPKDKFQRCDSRLSKNTFLELREFLR